MRHGRPKKKNNLTVTPRRNESAERMVKRFNKKVKKLGIIDEAKDRRYYKKPSDKKREDRKKAERRRIRDELKKQRALEKRMRKNR